MTRSTIEQPVPAALPIAQAVEILEAVQTMLDTLAGLDTEGTWETMTCTEVESVTEVFRAAGRHRDADYIITLHASGDDDGDMHHPDYDPDDDGSRQHSVTKVVEPAELEKMEATEDFNWGVQSFWYVEPGRFTKERWFYSPDGRGRIFYDSREAMEADAC